MDSARRLPTRDLPIAHVLHREIGRLLAPVWVPLAVAVLRFGLGYRIAAIKVAREKFRRIRSESTAPLLLCANHLTMIDSFIIAWALAPTWRNAFRYDELPWNIPERKNFATTFGERVSAYVMKCIPITRGGAREEVAAVLDRVARLTRGGEVALIFPEGGRSRTGRVETEEVAWGVGRIVSAIPRCRVVCVYLRGRKQETWSPRPVRGDVLDVEVECIEPKSDARGVRRSRDFSRQIVAHLASMERKYFGARE